MDLLRAGQVLSIYFQKGDKIVEMICTISEIFDDRLVIDLPPYFMRYIEYLDVGCELTVKVFSKLGTLDFNTMVISSPLEDEFSVELDYNAVRLTPNDELPVIGAVETLQLSKGENVYKVKTFEISTEYLKFYSDRSFDIDSDFDCILFLPKNYGTISFKAIISEIDPVYENEYTISYYNMTEEGRQMLLYYMYVYSNNSD